MDSGSVFQEFDQVIEQCGSCSTPITIRRSERSQERREARPRRQSTVSVRNRRVRASARRSLWLTVSSCTS